MIEYAYMRNKVKESKSCFTSVMERDKKFRTSFYHMPLLKTLDITCFIHVFQFMGQLMEKIDSQCVINFSMFLLTSQIFKLVTHCSIYSRNGHVQ